jgi:HAD superfamily hydrolase (TIGR01490 family)
MNRKVSCFDLDHTLLQVNSSFRFGVYLYKKGVFSFFAMLYLAGCYTLHSLHIISIPTLQNLIFKKLFLGRSYSEMQEHANAFFEQHFYRILYLPAIIRLQQVQQEGQYTVILSSSPDFLVKLCAERLKVDAWAATEYALDRNNCFSKISKFMLGEAKASYLQALGEFLAIPKKDMTAYSDSHLDLPFLQAAGTAVGVNPNKILRILCEENNWAIL